MTEQPETIPQLIARFRERQQAWFNAAKAASRYEDENKFAQLSAEWGLAADELERLEADAAPRQHRRACECAEPDPVMQADRKFYCYRCSFETGARPTNLPEMEAAAPLRVQPSALADKAETAHEPPQR